MSASTALAPAQARPEPAPTVLPPISWKAPIAYAVVASLPRLGQPMI